ncbi:MAG: hypothetical protein ABSD92_10120 [Candidatus Bathyarchaeia archaeon]|jgi:hypothetical protein
MPLTNSVDFKAMIGKGNRIQIPTLIRWEFKLESTQLLRVQVRQFAHGIDETFYVKMTKDGRITIPKLNTSLMQNQFGEEENLFHFAFEVTIRPG